MQKSRLKSVLILSAIIALVGMAFIGMSYTVGIGGVLRRMDHADVVWILLIVGAQSFAYFAYVIPYKFVYKLGFRDAASHSFQGFLPLRPAGGLVYDYAAHKNIARKAICSYLGLWEYVVLAPAILIAAIYAFINRAIPSELSLPWIIGVPTGVLLFVIGLIYKDHLRKFKTTNRVLNMLSGMIKHTAARDTLFLLLGMTLYWTGEIFALYGALQLFHIELGWFALLIAYATAYLFSRRSLPLGGAGIVLIMLALSLHWVGAALSVALLAALAYQIFNLLIPIIYCRISPMPNPL